MSTKSNIVITLQNSKNLFSGSNSTTESCSITGQPNTKTNQSVNSDLSVKLYKCIDSLPATYEKFFKDLTKKDFFSSKEWQNLIINTTLENDSKPLFYAVESNDTNSTPKALLIFTQAQQNGARIKGWWVHKHSIAGMTNYQCYSHTLLHNSDKYNLKKIVTLLLRQLKKDKYPVIDLNLFTDNSQSLPILKHEFNRLGMKSHIYDYCCNWVEDTSHFNYDKYLANRPRSKRREAARQLRRLKEKYDVRFELLTKEKDANLAIRLFDEVYKKSWKEPEYFTDFTPALIQTCAANETLRFGILYLDDHPVSIELCIVANNKATFAKSVYDLDYAKFSPGSVLYIYMAEKVINNDKVELISFGYFDGNYKKWWCEEKRHIKGIVAFNTETFWGNIAYIAYSFSRYKSMLIDKIKSPVKSFRDKYLQKLRN